MTLCKQISLQLTMTLLTPQSSLKIQSEFEKKLEREKNNLSLNS